MGLQTCLKSRRQLRAATVAATVVAGIMATMPSATADVASTNAVAWGFNMDGEVGSGSGMEYHTSPVPVAGGHQFTKVAAGISHHVALDGNGAVWVWGDKDPLHYNPDPFTPLPNDPVPVQVAGLTGVTGVAAGADISFAIRQDGTLLAWGANEEGQLGDGTKVDRTAPVQVPGLSGVVAAAAGESHTIVARQDGTVWAWGDNSRGQLGDGTKTDRLAPVQVKNLTDVVAVAASTFYSLALRSNGEVWAWGTNEKGELGNGMAAPDATSTIPVQVTGLTGVSKISAGRSHALALRSNGEVWAWGFNFTGQLGDGTTTQRSTPVRVPGLGSATDIGAGSFGSAAVVNGTVYVWGRNDSGQFGDGTTPSFFTIRTTPGPVPSLSGVQKLAVSGCDLMVLRNS